MLLVHVPHIEHHSTTSMSSRVGEFEGSDAAMSDEVREDSRGVCEEFQVLTQPTVCVYQKTRCIIFQLFQLTDCIGTRQILTGYLIGGRIPQNLHCNVNSQ